MKAMKVSERMRGYRARRQAAGLRLIQLWVPDTRSPRFAAECRRQCRLLKGDPAEADALEFIARAGAWDDSAPR
ncbi:MAG: antitoxin MazE family protein [Betaproteobacteria bacterium]|nr:antitoxin MazE family protein [Betaproteobacteria bacterium]